MPLRKVWFRSDLGPRRPTKAGEVRRLGWLQSLRGPVDCLSDCDPSVKSRVAQLPQSGLSNPLTPRTGPRPPGGTQFPEATVPGPKQQETPHRHVQLGTHHGRDPREDPVYREALPPLSTHTLGARPGCPFSAEMETLPAITPTTFPASWVPWPPSLQAHWSWSRLPIN